MVLSWPSKYFISVILSPSDISPNALMHNYSVFFSFFSLTLTNTLGLYKLDDDYDERIIRDLVPEEFDEIVMQDTEYTWIVEFYSDRCTAVYFF